MSVLSSTSCGIACTIQSHKFFEDRGYVLINEKTGHMRHCSGKFISKYYSSFQENSFFSYTFGYKKCTYVYELKTMEDVLLLEKYFNENRIKHKIGLLQKMMKHSVSKYPKGSL